MADRIQLLYRAESHLLLWRVVEAAGIWKQLGVEVEFRYCDTPEEAEAAIIAEEADFISGNHITPYLRKAQKVPLVCIAQPWKRVRDALVSRDPIARLDEIAGKSILDRPLFSPRQGVVHPRGNHILLLERAGLDPFRDVHWKEDPALRRDRAAMEAVVQGEADLAFISQHEQDVARTLGLHVLLLEPLPMIHGPTLTAYAPHLARNPELATVALQGLARGIRYFFEYPAQTQAILAALSPERPPAAIATRYETVGSMLEPTMYPELEGIANAFRLCRMAYGDAVRGFNPIAVWDLHYLRQLDDAGLLASAS